MSDSPGAAGRAFVALQHLLPQHAISRLVLRATRSRNAAFKNALIRLFVRGFKPDMNDAVEIDPTAYGSFNDFFTRALRPGTRPVDADPLAVVSPVRTPTLRSGAASPRRWEVAAISVRGRSRFSAMSTASAFSGDTYTTRVPLTGRPRACAR